MTELRTIELEIERGIERMQRDLGIEGSRGEGSSPGHAPMWCGLPTRKDGRGILPRGTMYRVGQVALASMIVAALAYVPFAQGQTPTPEQLFSTQTPPIICTNERDTLAVLSKDKRFFKPLLFSDQQARDLSVHVGQMAPVGQVILVATADGKLLLLVCGLNNSWQPRHFTLDVEAERRFYNVAPEIPSEEQPKKRTRRPKQ